jgi:hypothetical protein
MARREQLALTRELAAYEAARAAAAAATHRPDPANAARGSRTDPPARPTGPTHRPTPGSAGDPPADPPAGRVIQLRHSNDSPEATSGDAVTHPGRPTTAIPLEAVRQLEDAVYGDRRPSDATVRAIRAVLTREQPSGRIAAKTFNVPDTTVNRWVGRFRRAAEEAATGT